MFCTVILCRQSKTLPSSPKITSKAAAEEKEKKKSKHASADDESSPKHFALAKLFRRKEKGRSHSIQEYDMKQREEKKSGKKGAKISFPMRSKDTLSVVSTCISSRYSPQAKFKSWWEVVVWAGLTIGWPHQSIWTHIIPTSRNICIEGLLGSLTCFKCCTCMLGESTVSYT